MRTRFQLAISLLVFNSACDAQFVDSPAGASDSGGEKDSGVVADGGGLTLASLDDRCGDSDLTGRKVLSKIGTARAATLTPSPSATSTPLAIRFAYKGGTIGCRPYASFPVRGSTQSFPAAIGVPVEVTFATGDETAVAYVELVDRSDRAQLTLKVPTSELHGTFVPKIVDPNVTMHELLFYGTFDEASTEGAVRELASGGAAGSDLGYQGQWR